MRGASARPFNPRAFIRDAISAPGRHAPSLAPPPLVKTSCFHCSKYQYLNLKQIRFCLLSFVFCLLSFGFELIRHVTGQPSESCRLGFAYRDVGERTEEAWTNLPGANLNNACVGPVGVRRKDAPNIRDCRSFR